MNILPKKRFPNRDTETWVQLISSIPKTYFRRLREKSSTFTLLGGLKMPFKE